MPESSLSYVIFTCSCGNYVAEPTVENAAADQPGRWRHAGAIYCTAPEHGIFRPEMRRVEVEEVSATLS